MLTELSNTDYNRISQQKLRLIEHFFSEYKSNPVSLASSVLKLYKAAGITEMPNVYIADGPDCAADMIQHLKGRHTGNIRFPHLVYGQYSDALSIGDRLFDYANQVSRECVQESKRHFSDEARSDLRNMVFSDLNFQCMQAFTGIIHDVQTERYRLKGLRYDELPALYPTCGDFDWVGFYSILREAIQLHIPVPGFYEDFIMRGGYCIHAFNSFAVIVLRPSAISRNENLVLHAERGPALRWADGVSYYFWNGVRVPEKLIEAAHSVGYDDIVSEANAEVRRCYQEILGSERFANILGIESIDIKTDRAGNELVLYRTRDIDKIAGDHLYFAKVICPSTARTYFLCVPPQIRSAEEAVAWTFGKSPGDYLPIIET